MIWNLKSTKADSFLFYFFQYNSKSILTNVTGNRRDLPFKSVQILRAYFTHTYLFIYILRIYTI